jgi:hypothetical protein
LRVGDGAVCGRENSTQRLVRDPILCGAEGEKLREDWSRPVRRLYPNPCIRLRNVCRNQSGSLQVLGKRQHFVAEVNSAWQVAEDLEERRNSVSGRVFYDLQIKQDPDSVVPTDESSWQEQDLLGRVWAPETLDQLRDIEDLLARMHMEALEGLDGGHKGKVAADDGSVKHLSGKVIEGPGDAERIYEGEGEILRFENGVARYLCPLVHGLGGDHVAGFASFSMLGGQANCLLPLEKASGELVSRLASVDAHHRRSRCRVLALVVARNLSVSAEALEAEETKYLFPHPGVIGGSRDGTASV